MEPLLKDMKATALEARGLAGVELYGSYKIDLAVFMHVNELDPFQAEVIPIFMKPTYTVDDLSRTILRVSRYVKTLEDSRWEPSKPGGDMVNQPKHYSRFPIEPTFFNRENRIDWNRGNALKYLCRYAFKNGLEDLRKAMRYLALEIRFLQAEASWSKGGGA